jgi:acetyltransferase-like isoleucine patch superfamily enzyme
MQLVTRIWLKFLTKWWQLSVPIRLRMLGVVIGTGSRFYGMPTVLMAKNSRIILGDNVTLCSDSRFTALGLNHHVVLRTLYANSEIRIGSNCGISGSSICAAEKIELEDDCLVGANVTIFDTDFHTVHPANRRVVNSIAISAVKVERNVFIGANAMILKGVRIGQNSVIGAGAVVTKNVADDVIVAGNPACLIRKL